MRATRAPLRLAVTIVVAASAVPWRAQAACESARITAAPGALSGAWAAAVEALQEAVQREGMPWSCTGGEVLVEVDGEALHASLRFRDSSGREVIRHVPSARELVTTAEALLAVTAPPPAPSRPPPAPSVVGEPTSIPAPPTAAPAPLSRAPRLLAEALIGARYGAPNRAIWFAPELRALLPIEAWSVGLWTRYALPYTLDPVPDDFSMFQVNVGFSGGRELLRAPIDLRLSVDPSLAVISMEGDTGEDHASGAKIDFQLGVGLAATLPFTEAWRGVLRIDGEIAPAELRGARRIDPSLPPLSAYQIGAAIGIERVVR